MDSKQFLLRDGQGQDIIGKYEMSPRACIHCLVAVYDAKLGGSGYLRKEGPVGRSRPLKA